MINTFDIAHNMLGGANASYEISFGYNTATGKSAVAYYNRGVSEAQHSLGNKPSHGSAWLQHSRSWVWGAPFDR